MIIVKQKHYETWWNQWPRASIKFTSSQLYRPTEWYLPPLNCPLNWMNSYLHTQRVTCNQVAAIAHFHRNSYCLHRPFDRWSLSIHSQIVGIEIDKRCQIDLVECCNWLELPQWTTGHLMLDMPILHEKNNYHKSIFVIKFHYQQLKQGW